MATDEMSWENRFNTAEIVGAAIAMSIANHRVEYMDGWIEYVDQIQGVSKMLEAQSDEVVEERSAREYSGMDRNGCRWRVHLDVLAEEDG